MADEVDYEKMKEKLKRLKPGKLVKKTPKESDKKEKKSKSKKTPAKSVEKQYKELLDPKKKKQKEQSKLGKAKRVAAELSKKNVDMKKIEKILDKLSPLERSRRNLIENLLENSEEKDILVEIIQKAQKKDPDFADILGAFSKKKLLKALEEFVSQRETDDSIQFLEEIILADPALKINYENILKEKEEERLEKVRKRQEKEKEEEEIELEEEEETTDEEKEEEGQVVDDDFGDSRLELVNNLVKIKNDIKEVKNLIKKYKKKDTEFAELLLNFDNKVLVELLTEIETSPPYDITQFFEDKQKKKSPKRDFSVKAERKIKVIIDPELEEQFEKRFGKKEDRKVEERVIDKTYRIVGIDQFCLTDQALKPWIRNYISTWLAAPDGEELDDKYVTKSHGLIGESIEHEGRKFYKANSRFNYLQCNYFSNRRVQNGNVLTLYEDATKPVRFIVLHEVSNDFIIQDEALFKKEVEYQMYKEKNESKKLKYFLNKKIDNDKIKNALYNISMNEILKHCGEYKDYNEFKQYVDKIVKILLEKSKDMTVNDYLVKLSGLVIYLDTNIMGNYAINFNNKFLNRFYKPESIDSLKNRDKLPEVFLNKDLGAYQKGISDSVAQRIDYYTNLKSEQIGRLLVREIAGSISGKRRLEIEIPKFDLELSNLKDSCENKEDISNLNIWEYVPYEEDGKVYCISIYNKFTDTNPYTGKKFSDDFIEYLAKLDENTIHKYLNIQLFGDDLEEPEEAVEAIPIPSPSDSKKSLTPGLIDLLYKDLAELEENLVEGKASVDLKCDYCKDHILSDNPLKTLVKRKESSKIVQFCSVDCFERWNPKSK